MTEGIRHLQISDIEAGHVSNSKGYEYYERKLVSLGEKKQCNVSVYEIPPGKAVYPYHYHMQNEETFYIISGTGTLRTPEGDKTVRGGDLIYFPPGEKGAHKLTNSSDKEKLVYIDFDTNNAIDVVHYPDSDKIGIYGRDISQLHRNEDKVDYYHGE